MKDGVDARVVGCYRPALLLTALCGKQEIGAWLSLVERYTGGVEVAGSNPVAPTIFSFGELNTSSPFLFPLRMIRCNHNCLRMLGGRSER